MAVIGVFDYDFFNYSHVVPNLECAKLVTYHRRHNNIAVLSPALKPSKYTQFIIRKEYDDGNFPREFFFQNCVYGGRAFNPQQYIPLAPGIENTIPDMHIYDDYVTHFGYKKTEVAQIKRILNCAHMRLAPDSQNLLSFERLKRNFANQPSGIFLHDYDLASLKPYDLIVQLQNSRTFKTRDEINPYPVGNKFPIRVYSPEELARWMQIIVIPGAFFLEYYGLMSDQILYNLCMDNKRMARQLYYNITYGCADENEFLMRRLPQIFVQCLFLRKANIKILLSYEDGFFVTSELEHFIELLNCWLSFQWQENFLPTAQSLYAFCRDAARFHYTNWAFVSVTIPIDTIRNIFQYIREQNYELFVKFYEWDSVSFKGGKFVNDWERSQE